ncbi:MAG: hypothetical protein IT531_00170 [Burkholderiales bacterium]|nr:hypothetical protein [Burkholderiales bacterium]
MLIADLHRQGVRPAALLVSEREKRDLKQEIMAASKAHSLDAEHADHDRHAIGFVGGIPVISHRDVPRGQARVITKTDVADRNRDLVVR